MTENVVKDHFKWTLMEQSTATLDDASVPRKIAIL